MTFPLADNSMRCRIPRDKTMCGLSHMCRGSRTQIAAFSTVFTSVERWYKNPLILPAVSNSDHFSVIFQPTLSPPSRKVQRIFNYRRSCNPTGQLMLCYTLQRYNWKPLYAMDSCDDQIQYFYTVLLKLLDEYLPYVHVTKYTGDKPWVTQQFKDVISRRQREPCCQETSKNILKIELKECHSP